MEKMNFSVDINAPKERVWDALWEDASYREWTSAFAEGSHAVTDGWKEGTKVLFLGPNGGGMVSMVAENKPYRFMSFKHLGEVVDGVEDTTSEKIKQWSGALENYTLTETGSGTHLDVYMEGNLSEEFIAYFSNTWPTALQKLKELGEK